MDINRLAEHVVSELRRLYPLADCTLRYEKPYELLFATRLAAQCTDARVNIITEKLYKKYPTLEALAESDPDELQEMVRSSGFYRAKARDIRATANILLSDYNGKVPDTMEALLKLPGVGRKTANLILGDVFGKPAIVADTHCIRISNRIGLADSKDPYKVELRLKELIPDEDQNDTCHRMVLHGRAVCRARGPRCGFCPLAPMCRYVREGNV